MTQDNRRKWEEGPGEALGRRDALRLLLAGLGGILAAVNGRRAFAFSNYRNAEPTRGSGDFTFAQLAYRGGEWDPDPTAVPSLLKELESSTSIVSGSRRAVVRAGSPDLFDYPFVYMTGTADFEAFSDEEVLGLRRYLKAGGVLVGDDGACTPGYGFDAGFRREIGRILPGSALERLPAEHTVFRSFFLIRGMGGRKVVSPFMEGVDLQKRTAVLYSPNGIGAAWAKDLQGEWAHPVVPGGERQRRLAFQLGVNLIMYALCSDYKQDRIHLPFLRQKI